MTHILASAQASADLMYFENLQEVVTMAVPHVAFALGVDEGESPLALRRMLQSRVAVVTLARHH